MLKVTGGPVGTQAWGTAPRWTSELCLAAGNKGTPRVAKSFTLKRRVACSWRGQARKGLSDPAPPRCNTGPHTSGVLSRVKPGRVKERNGRMGQLPPAFLGAL